MEKQKLLIGFWDGEYIGIAEITSEEDISYIESLKNEGYTEEDVLNLDDIIGKSRIIFLKKIDCFFELAEEY